ncbi:MAG: phage major capsid protein [Planctomycetota bacterium]
MATEAAKPETDDDKFDSLMEKLDKQADKFEVVLSQRKSGGAVIAGYEKDDNPFVPTAAQMKSMRRGRNLQHMRDLYDSGYQPKIKSFGDFLRGVASSQVDPGSAEAIEFKNDYASTKKSILTAMSQGLPAEAAAAKMKAIGMNTFEAEHGGVMITPEFSNQLLQREFDFLDIYGRTQQFTVGGNTMVFPKLSDTDRRDGSRHGGIVSGWAGEEQLMSSSRLKLEDITLSLSKMFAVVFASEEALQDTVGNTLQQLISLKTDEALKFTLGNAVFRGDGVKKPTGLLNSPGRVTVAKEVGQPASTLTGVNIIEMYRRRLANKTGKYVWLMNQNIEAQLAQITLGAGEASQLTYMPPNGLAEAPHGTLMGLPIMPCEFSSTLGTEGDIMLVCLDEYYTISRGGIAEDTSRHVEFLRDQTAFKFTMRVDGKLCEDEPIIPFQGDPVNDTQSAVITLETRA